MGFLCALSAAVLGNLLAAPSVNYVVTVPGPEGVNVAFLAEVVITFILMTVILHWAGCLRYSIRE